MKTRRSLVLALVFSFGVFAADKGPLTDNIIADRVQLKLAEDVVVKGGGLKVDCKDGVVTLSGKVEHEQQKSKAEKLTRKIRGVKSVDNKIVVTPVR